MWPSVVVCRATAVTTTVAALGEPCVSRDSRADDLIRAAVLAADLLGVSSFGGLDYRLSSGLRVVINDTVAWRSAVIAARYRRVRVPPLHHLGDQQTSMPSSGSVSLCGTGALCLVAVDQRGGVPSLGSDGNNSGAR